MSAALLFPLGLAALAALLLPVLLHLDRRAESRPTDFAALRWLSARLRPRRKLRFEELWLLLLRVLLVASVAMLFARPVLFGAQGGEPWVLVAPGIALDQARALERNSAAQWHWLAADFPPIEATRPAGTQPLASLLREIDATLPIKTAVTVIVPERVDGLDGERPKLAREIEWRVVSEATTEGTTEGTTDGTATSAASADDPATGQKSAAPAPTLVIRHAADRASGLRYFRAAAVAWRSAAASAEDKTGTSLTDTAGIAADALDIGLQTQALPADARWLVWLVPGQLPPAIRAWIENGGVALLDANVRLPDDLRPVESWRNSDGALLASTAKAGQGRVVILHTPLRPDDFPLLLEPEFSAQLRAQFEGPPPAPTRAYSEALKPVTGGALFAETPRPLDDWLILLAAALFAFERWFASSAKRRRAT